MEYTREELVRFALYFIFLVVPVACTYIYWSVDAMTLLTLALVLTNMIYIVENNRMTHIAVLEYKERNKPLLGFKMTYELLKVNGEDTDWMIKPIMKIANAGSMYVRYEMDERETEIIIDGKKSPMKFANKGGFVGPKAENYFRLSGARVGEDVLKKEDRIHVKVGFTYWTVSAPSTKYKYTYRGTVVQNAEDNNRNPIIDWYDNHENIEELKKVDS